VDERRVSELEATIADAGALVVRLQKYRRGSTPEADAVVRAAMAVGDRARRLHHRGALDEAAVARLLAEAGVAVARLRELLAGVHHAPEYRAALVARAAGDQDTLGRTLPHVFAGLERLARPPDLFAPVGWRRRGRPLPAAEVAAGVLACRTDGIAAEGDDLTPGTDPRLTAVTLAAAPPADEPVLLRFPGWTLPLPVYRLVDIDAHLVYCDALRAPFVVRLAAGPGDEDPRVAVDWPTHRARMAEALVTAGVSVEDG
jgi:hypothetical protein